MLEIEQLVFFQVQLIREPIPEILEPIPIQEIHQQDSIPLEPL